MATYQTTDTSGIAYPLTKMNFLVTVDGKGGIAAFSEVSGVQASVDVIPFRQGNSHSLAPVKIPGLVRHEAVTMRMGYTINNEFKKWITECVSETREEIPRRTVQVELIDTNVRAPKKKVNTTVDGARIWQLKNAWVSSYTAPDLDANDSNVAIEAVEICYEELVIPN